MNLSNINQTSFITHLHTSKFKQKKFDPEFFPDQILDSSSISNCFFFYLHLMRWRIHFFVVHLAIVWWRWLLMWNSNTDDPEKICLPSRFFHILWLNWSNISVRLVFSHFDDVFFYAATNIYWKYNIYFEYIPWTPMIYGLSKLLKFLFAFSHRAKLHFFFFYFIFLLHVYCKCRCLLCTTPFVLRIHTHTHTQHTHIH